MPRILAKSLPVVGSPQPPAIAPVATAVDCLRCQLIGRRRLLCAQADACKAAPLVFPLGPVLLAAWAATAIAFLVAVW